MKYDWKDAGEEWSEPWGSSAAQWEHAIFPRIRVFLPVHTILEIGSGFGRWTHYLREYCQHLLVLDRNAECIEACRERFGQAPGFSYHVNDGRSLSMFHDASIDFVFSFDSLVHPNRDIVENYVKELAKKLRPGGKGFFHHSNLGAYARSMSARLPAPVARLMRKAKLLDWAHNRNPTMSAELFRSFCRAHGLHCLRQELVNWRGRRLIDCFSTFACDAAGEDGATEIVRNPSFMREAEQIRRRASPL